MYSIAYRRTGLPQLDEPIQFGIELGNAAERHPQGICWIHVGDIEVVVVDRLIGHAIEAECAGKVIHLRQPGEVVALDDHRQIESQGSILLLPKAVKLFYRRNNTAERTWDAANAIVRLSVGPVHAYLQSVHRGCKELLHARRSEQHRVGGDVHTQPLLRGKGDDVHDARMEEWLATAYLQHALLAELSNLVDVVACIIVRHDVARNQAPVVAHHAAQVATRGQGEGDTFGFHERSVQDPRRIELSEANQFRAAPGFPEILQDRQRHATPSAPAAAPGRVADTISRTLGRSSSAILWCPSRLGCLSFLLIQ